MVGQYQFAVKQSMKGPRDSGEEGTGYKAWYKSNESYTMTENCWNNIKEGAG